MELFVAVILFGVIIYELYTGAIPVKRRRAIARVEKPFQYWFWIVVQAVAIITALLIWSGIIKLS